MITLDGSRLLTRQEALPYLQQALDLPRDMGQNLDALYDCLTELGQTRIRLTAPEEATPWYHRLLQVLQAAEQDGEIILL